MTADFSSVLFTSEDKALLLSELEIFKRNLYSAHPQITDLSALGISDLTQKFWTSVLGQGELHAADIEMLRQLIGKSTLVRLTVPVALERSDIQQIVSLVRKQTGTKNLFVQIEIDASLVAGATLSLHGKLIDLSLAKRLQQIDLKAILHKHVQVTSPAVV